MQKTQRVGTPEFPALSNRKLIGNLEKLGQTGRFPGDVPLAVVRGKYFLGIAGEEKLASVAVLGDVMRDVS